MGRMEIERRYVSDKLELRAEEGKEPFIVGYGARYNRMSEDLGGFREVIEPGAFDDVLSDDVRGLFNHDENFVLGRTTADTMKLSSDEDGLRYEITPPRTALIRDLVLSPLERGDISQSSFAFTLGEDGDEVEFEQGQIVRHIVKVKRLYDVSVVTFPAYADAGSGLSTRTAAKIEKIMHEGQRLLAESEAQIQRKRLRDRLYALKSRRWYPAA